MADTRSSHRTLDAALEHVPDRMLEVTFTLRGGSAPIDHRYVLYSALKKHCCRRLTERGWQIRPIQGGEVAGDALQFDRRDDPPTITVRLPSEDLEYLKELGERPLRLSNHVLLIESSTVRPVKPNNTLASELVIVCNESRAPQGYRAGNLGLAIGKRLGAWFGRADFGVTIGPRRTCNIKSYTYHGNAVSITGITNEESVFLQANGIGARNSMGCGTFWHADEYGF